VKLNLKYIFEDDIKVYQNLTNKTY